MVKKSNTFLETEPIGKLMAKYAVPCVISLLVAALYNIVDQIFIANADYLGSYGNAANTVVFPVTVVALSIAVMIGDTIKRILALIPILIAVIILIFSIMYIAPGDPAQSILGTGATDEQLAAKRAELGLDKSYFEQLGNYFYQLVFEQDLGRSYITRVSIAEELAQRFPYTLLLAVSTIVLVLIVGVLLGVYAALHQNRLVVPVVYSKKPAYPATICTGLLLILVSTIACFLDTMISSKRWSPFLQQLLQNLGKGSMVDCWKAADRYLTWAATESK